MADREACNQSNTVLHLGKIDKPILIFGGVYSNLQALEALYEVAKNHKLLPEQCICTGDIVAYCGQPKETVSLIRQWGVHCLMGNCEESFASNADDCGCGFNEGSQCDILSNQWFAFANQQLGNDERKWFSHLPRQIYFTINNISVLVVHGGVSSINQFIFESTHEDIFAEAFLSAKTDIIIGGHSGIPFTKKIGTKTWHNSGAIGMPANDGTQATWYSIITPEKNHLRITHKKLYYDNEKTSYFMQKEKRHNQYANTLHTGLWPSEDILLNAEKNNRGNEIKESEHII